MSNPLPNDSSKLGTIDLKEQIAQAWKDDPRIGFEHRASLAIARWVLSIFGGVYVLAFIALFGLLFKTDASFEKGSELVKFMVQSLLPLVTLAVGYYLGDRHRPFQQQGATPRKR
jgi:hypothetical protein